MIERGEEMDGEMEQTKLYTSDVEMVKLSNIRLGCNPRHSLGDEGR